MKEGYSVVAYTDHNFFISHNILTDSDFVALNGIEYGVNNVEFGGVSDIKFRKNCDICMIALYPDIDKTYDQINTDFVFRYTPESVNEFMSQSDVVTIHAPSIPATDNMINKNNLALMKDGTILINTSRGTVINEQDLIEELEKGRIFACIDVTNPEQPATDNKLRDLNNVVLTPHIAVLFQTE